MLGYSIVRSSANNVTPNSEVCTVSIIGAKKYKTWVVSDVR
jgi:hypothetical protein